MNVRIQILIAILVIVMLIAIVNMIRRRQVDLRYTLCWLCVGVGILILDCFPQLLTAIARLVGIATPVNLLFFLGFCFSLIIVFDLTLTVSKLSNQVKQLTQELAIHKKEEK